MDITKIGKRVSKDKGGTRFVSLNELCNIFGCDANYISHLEKNLGMPKDAKGSYDLKKCSKWYIEHLKGKIEGSSGTALNREKIILTRAKARKAEIESELLSGDTISYSKTVDELSTCIEALKNSFSNFASVAANKVIGMKESEIYEYIDKEIASCINEFADGIEKITQE